MRYGDPRFHDGVMRVRLRGDQRTDQLMNAALHGTVEEQEHRAPGLVDTDLNGDAGFLELACQIWQGLIEGVFGIHGATLEGMRVGSIGAALGPPGLARRGVVCGRSVGGVDAQLLGEERVLAGLVTPVDERRARILLLAQAL